MNYTHVNLHASGIIFLDWPTVMSEQLQITMHLKQHFGEFCHLTF